MSLDVNEKVAQSQASMSNNLHQPNTARITRYSLVYFQSAIIGLWLES